MIASTTPQYIGSELFIDYNTIRFTPIKSYSFIKVKKNMYGSVFLQHENQSKIVWSNKVYYDIETQLLPMITIPIQLKDRCKKMIVSYDIDDTYNWITIQNNSEQYVFRRNIVVQSNGDTIVKIFLTQLLFDSIIRNLNQN
jgi:hypothetical protein